MALFEECRGRWWLHTRIDAHSLGTALQADGAHIADLEVHPGADALRFSAVALPNRPGGAYWWYFGLDGAAVGARLTEHGAVPVSLTCYRSAGGMRMAVAMRRAPGQGYWWYFGLSASDLGQRLAAHDALPVDICAYEEGGQLWFAAVMVPARGKRHAWYFGQHPHDVTRLLRETGGQLHMLRGYATTAGTRYVVVIHLPNQDRSWWYWGQTPDDIRRNALFNGAFPSDITVYREGGGDRYACVMRERTGLTTDSTRHRRVRAMIEASQQGGYFGFYLRKTGGSVIEAFNEDVVFDPCSCLKALVHAHALRAVQDGAQFDGAPLTLATTVAVPDHTTGSCPFDDPGDPASGWQSGTLRDALQRAMRDSSNITPEAVRQALGPANVAASAQQLGMPHTRHLGPTGCKSNEATLLDFANLYERCASIFLDATHWDLFRNLARSGEILAAVERRCGALMQAHPLPADFPRRFRAHCVGVLKRGNGSDGDNHKKATAGYIAIPFCTDGRVVLQGYVYGVFSEYNRSGPTLDYEDVAAEMLSGEILAAIRSFAGGSCSL